MFSAPRTTTLSIRFSGVGFSRAVDLENAMNSSDSVSVLLPVRNADAYLRVCMAGILAQTHRDFEIIAIDDGSTDGSLPILRSFEAADSRVRVIAQENRGLADTLNRAIEESSSEFLARHDADDISTPDRLQRQVAFMKANPKIGLLGGAINVVDQENRLILTTRFPITHDGIGARLKKASAFCHPATFYRKSVVAGVGGYRRQFCPAEDYDLWLRMWNETECANLAEVVLNYRQHTAQLSHSAIDQQVLGAIGAQVIADRRAAEGVEPRLPVDTITAGYLGELGVQRSEIDEAFVRSAVSRLSYHRRSWSAACDSLLREAEQRAMRHPGRHLLEDVNWLVAKHRFTEGMFADAIVRCVKSGSFGRRFWRKRLSGILYRIRHR